MKEIIDKISSYNLFNYLFPGVVFVVFLKEATKFNLVLDNNFLGAFLYYFIGLVVSRFGSLVIGFIIEKTSMIKGADYTEYIKASIGDNKVELFSEINNMYRTFISLFTLLLLAKLFEEINSYTHIPNSVSFTILIVLLLILFFFSYKKQTGFITKRVKHINNLT